ncbi:MAG: hypothetical protein ACOYEV_08400 [Candidatus Nanopelagicales bacterium]
MSKGVDTVEQASRPDTCGPAPGGQISRRRFLSAMSGLLGLAAGGALTSCSLPPVQSAAGMGGDRSGRERYLGFSLFPDYIDGAPDGPFVTLDRFSTKTGIQVQLKQDIIDVPAYMDALSARFQAGLPSPTDLLVMPEQLLFYFNRSGWRTRA